MELNILLKIKENPKIYDYLHENSRWYRKLNRKSSYYDELIKKYKSDNRAKNMSKVNDAIENAEMISNILKVVE